MSVGLRRVLYILVVIVSYAVLSCTEDEQESDFPIDSREKIKVWMDVDPANGIGEVDDGLMMIAGFQSKRIDVRGVSVVFGNSPVVYGAAIGGNIVKAYGPSELKDMGVYLGAANANELGAENEAVQSLAEELEALDEDERIVLLAVGPLTNVATVVKQHPNQNHKIKQIVIVAGRRPGQLFLSGDMAKNRGKMGGFQDLNFESDVEAMRVLLESEIEIVLVPWEVSSHVWLTRNDVDGLREKGGERGAFIYATTQHWFETWEQVFGAGIDKGFNPFDTLALGYVVEPKLFQTEQMIVAIERGYSDQAGEEMKMKDYLVVRPLGKDQAGEEIVREVTYVYGVDVDRFKDWLIDHLGD